MNYLSQVNGRGHFWKKKWKRIYSDQCKLYISHTKCVEVAKTKTLNVVYK